MKALFFTLLITALIVSCSEKRENYTTLDEDGNIIMTDASVDILKEIQLDYSNCKEEETEKNECNRFTAEAICRFYQIDDFKKDGDFVTYREIKDVVTLNGGSWTPIGIATNQADLNAAQKNANNTKATIAFDPNKTNHVAIILPGNTTKSGSWGLEVPNSASFFMHKNESYIDKGLSYSFSSPEGIILYTQK